MYSVEELQDQPKWNNFSSYDYASKISMQNILHSKAPSFDTAKNIGCIVDVTKKYKENRYVSSIVNCLPNAAILKSKDDLSVLAANQNYEELSKKWPIEIINEIISLEESVLEEDAPIRNMPTSAFLGNDGKIIRLSVSITLIKDGNKKLLGILTCCDDTSNQIPHNKLLSLYRKFYDDPKISTKLFVEHIGLDKHLNSKKDILTNRELDCLIMLAKGQTAKETARELDISPRTVETHLENIKIKFNARNKTEMLAIFLSCFSAML